MPLAARSRRDGEHIVFGSGFFAGILRWGLGRRVYRADTPRAVPNLDRRELAREKALLRGFQGSGVGLGFDNLRALYFAVFAEKIAAIGSHGSPLPEIASGASVSNGSCNTSSVLVTRKQVQPVSLQTR